MSDKEIHKARSIGELLADFIHGSELEQPLLERKVLALLPEVLGATVVQYLGESEVKNGGFAILPMRARQVLQALYSASSQPMAK